MMLRSVRRWWSVRWGRVPPDLARAYSMTFSTGPGQQVLKHLLDNVYCTIYEGTDPQAALVHNGRRSVVHEILLAIDTGDSPDKYRVATEERDAIGSPAGFTTN